MEKKPYQYKDNLLTIFIYMVFFYNFIFIAAFIFVKSYISLAITGVLLLIYYILIKLWKNSNKLSFLMLFLLLLTVHIGISGIFLIGKESGLQYFLFATASLSVFIFQNSKLFFKLIIPLIGLLFLVISELITPPIAFLFPSNFLLIMLIISLLGTFLLILSTSIIFTIQITHNEMFYYFKSITDPLTGLNNRSVMNFEISHIDESARRYNRNYALILIDIDHFKNVNDQYGHVEGDMVLKEISALILQAVRKCDYAFRYGGEEFLLLLPDTELTGAKKFAERLRNKIESHIFGKLRMTASFGVGIGPGLENYESLIQKVDGLLYLAKKNGRNRIEFADI